MGGGGALVLSQGGDGAGLVEFLGKALSPLRRGWGMRGELKERTDGELGLELKYKSSPHLVENSL